jgi:Uncharacterized protein conserved in bacteria (DUF2334)
MLNSEPSVVGQDPAATTALRNLRLLFAQEIAAGIVSPRRLDREDLRAAVRPRPVPARSRRWAQRVAMRLGKLAFERAVERYLRARLEVLGDRAEGEPRLLIRVDEFPHARAFSESSRYGSDAFLRFHAVLAEAGVPYLLAVLPWISRDYLDPAVLDGRPLLESEIDLLKAARADRVSFGLHGHSHQVRDRRRGTRSAISNVAPTELEELLVDAMTRLEPLGSSPRVFVPPFNHFDSAHYQTLAQLFDVVCGGPETVAVFGFQDTPQWRDGAVYLPSYPPLYGRAGEITTAVQELAARGAALWVPVVLHWAWEDETDLRELRRFATSVGRFACSWDEFLSAVKASR